MQWDCHSQCTFSYPRDHKYIFLGKLLTLLTVNTNILLLPVFCAIWPMGHDHRLKSTRADEAYDHDDLARSTYNQS